MDCYITRICDTSVTRSLLRKCLDTRDGFAQYQGMNILLDKTVSMGMDGCIEYPHECLIAESVNYNIQKHETKYLRRYSQLEDLLRDVQYGT